MSGEMLAHGRAQGAGALSVHDARAREPRQRRIVQVAVEDLERFLGSRAAQVELRGHLRERAQARRHIRQGRRRAARRGTQLARGHTHPRAAGLDLGHAAVVDADEAHRLARRADEDVLAGSDLAEHDGRRRRLLLGGALRRVERGARVLHEVAPDRMLARLVRGAQRASRLQQDLLRLAARAIDLGARLVEEAAALRLGVPAVVRGAPRLSRELLALEREASAFGLRLVERPLERAVQLGEVALSLVEYGPVEAEPLGDRERLARAGESDAQAVRRPQRRGVELDSRFARAGRRECERFQLGIVRRRRNEDVPPQQRREHGHRELRSLGGSWRPAAAMSARSPVVFNVTGLPPVFGPVTTSARYPSPIATETGTTCSPRSGCRASMRSTRASATSRGRAASMRSARCAFARTRSTYATASSMRSSSSASRATRAESSSRMRSTSCCSASATSRTRLPRSRISSGSTERVCPLADWSCTTPRTCERAWAR